MNIDYQYIKEISKEDLYGLFKSVEWESSKYPDKVQQAIKNSHRVVTAWDGDKLIGLINSLSDGVMTAYFHYMLVRPEYQLKGIGKKIITLMLEEYRGYRTKVLISYNPAIEFYKSCGFKVEDESSPLFIIDMV